MGGSFTTCSIINADVTTRVSATGKLKLPRPRAALALFFPGSDGAGVNVRLVYLFFV